MKKPCLVLLLFALLFCACGKDLQVEESGQDRLQTYQLPTEWKVTKNGETLRYAVAFEGGSATVTKDGKVLHNITLLRVTVDEAGNVVSREELNGSRLEAVYDADGRLAATLLRDRQGALQQRTEYDEYGRAVRVYTRRSDDDATLWEYTYGEDGELLTEALYNSHRSHTYEYHENGALAAETTYLLGTLPYFRREYGEDGLLTWEYEYDEEGNVSFRYEYDEASKIAATYDAEGNRYIDHREEKRHDGNGNLTEYKYQNDDGSLLWREEYDYDGDGNQISRRFYNGENTLLKEYFMTYDESGVLTATVERMYHFDGGELWGTIETQWDEEGNPAQETRYDADGSLLSRYVREYESIGGERVMTASFSYDGEGNLLHRQECAYDENGNLTVDLSYDADGDLSSRTEQIYDERGNLIESVRNDGDGNVTYREVSVYDGQNTLREMTIYRENGRISIHCVYDERGNVLEKTYYDGDVISTYDVYDYTYTYDDAGRLVSCTSAMPGGRRTYAYESGSGLRRETVSGEDGNILYTDETVYDNNGNPRIRQIGELRTEYEWGPEGGLQTCVRYNADKEVLSRLEASSYVACSLTEAQYRRLLELLLTATGVSETVINTVTD